MSAGHWTEEELLAHLYGVGPQDGHELKCKQCQSRLSDIEISRVQNELLYEQGSEVGAEFFAAQRRSIYARIGEPKTGFAVRRWVPGLAILGTICAGLVLFEPRSVHHSTQAAYRQAVTRVSDTALVEDVGFIAMQQEPDPAAPIKELFAE